MIFRTITDDITGANISIGLFGRSLNDFKGIINSFKQNGFVSTLLNTPLIKIDTDAIDVYNNQIRSSIPYEQALAVARKTTNACTLALIESSSGLEVQTERVTAAQLASTIATKAHSVALKAVSIAGNMILFTAIAKGIRFATTALDNWINRSKYAIETMEKAQQTINDAQNKLKNVSTTIEENKDRFLELSEGVDKFSKNIKLSEEDYAEYLSISNKLAAISPELITGYTEQGDALLYIGNNAEEVNKKLNTILEAEQAIAQQTLVDNMDDVARGIYYEVDKANFDIANLKAELNTVSTVFRDIEDIIKTVDDDIGSIDFGTGSGLNLDFDEMEQLKNAVRNSGAKITEDTVFDSMIFSSSEIPLVQKAIENFYKQLDYTRKNESAAYINGITKDIQARENAIKTEYAKMTPNLVAWVKSTYEYDFLDEQKKNLMESLIPNLDWNDIKDTTGMELFSGAEYEQYIKENIIVPLMSIPDEYQDDINRKFEKLLGFESGDIDIVDFASELQEYLDSIGITIDIKPLIGGTEELKKSYEQITNDAAYKFIEMSSKNYGLLDAERQALDDFAKQNSINTRDEIAFWNQCLEESTTREQAMEKYLGSSNSVNEKNNLSALLTSSHESLDKFQSSIKSASDAYATLLSGNYSASELLNSIQTINQAVGDMGGSLNWEYINQSEDSLKLLGDTIEHISQKYAESVLSGTGFDVNSDFGRMLADIIQETYEAEAEFTGMNAQLDALQSSYQTLTGILESYNDTGYISLDNLQSLLTADENLISMLEAENGQLVLNQEAYENLVAVQLLEFKEKLNNAAAAEIEALAKQKSAEATNSNAQASEDSVAKLDAETEAFNRNTSAAITNAVTKAEEEGVSEDEIQSVLDKYNEIWNAAVNNFDGDFDSFMGGTKSASKAGSSAGKEAGDAYVDAFEEELKELDDLHSNSLISEKEYLDRLRVLYERYFKDKLGYEKEFADYQKKYLDGYKSLYESVFSHASKVISDRIDSINDEKDVTIDSLEAQKKAADDSYNAQIKLLEDKKDALQAEIDKIKEANEDRKEAIDLQKAEYELARMQNQRTILQYSEDKGVHYVTDTSGIRDARNDLDDKKADAQIRALEKQQDALDMQIDAIQEMLDASDEYWDTQIEQTEKYYDVMIQGMEEYRSRWEELSDLQEHAEMIALLEELGYTEEDLADAGSGAFEALRTSYLGILKDMNDGNQSVLDGLSQLANIDMSSIPSFLGATQGYMNSIANMDVTALSDGLGNVCDGFSNFT